MALVGSSALTSYPARASSQFGLLDSLTLSREAGTDSWSHRKGAPWLGLALKARVAGATEHVEGGSGKKARPVHSSMHLSFPCCGRSPGWVSSGIRRETYQQGMERPGVRRTVRAGGAGPGKAGSRAR